MTFSVRQFEPCSATNTVTATISIEGNPWGVAVSPDGATVYVANSSALAEVVAIDAATNEVIGTFPLSTDSESVGVALSPDGATLYATDYDSSSGNPGSVWVITL
ncbi:MAG: YncE family protein [Mycolicibacterium sp.]